MARFRYSMQNILNIKLKLETQAKQDFQRRRQLWMKRKRDCRDWWNESADMSRRRDSFWPEG